MHKTFQIGAAIAAVMFALSSTAFAQSTPGTGAGADPAAGASAGNTAATDAPAGTRSMKKKPAKSKKMTRRQEADKSMKNGTVPARYRNSIPQAYQQYVPFEKQ